MADDPIENAVAGFRLARRMFEGAEAAPPARPALPRRPRPPEPPEVPTQRLFGVDVAAMTLAEVVDRIVGWAGRPPARIVVTCNLDHVMKLRDDAEFREVYAEADLVTADGMPFVWLSRREGRPLRERVTGSDLILPLVRAAAAAGRSVYLLGSTEARLAAAAARLEAEAPGLAIVGRHAPPFGFERDPEQLPALAERLREAAPDIVLVALGAPKQEKFSRAMARALGRGVFVNIGAGLDFLAADVKRAPKLVQDIGMEWLWRALSEPRRLGPRYARIVAALPSLLLAHHDDRLRRERAEMAERGPPPAAGPHH